MGNSVPCLRRTEPSAALTPRPGQRTLAYVPAERSDIRERIHEFNRRKIVQLRLNEEGAVPEIAHAPATISYGHLGGVVV